MNEMEINSSHVAQSPFPSSSSHSNESINSLSSLKYQGLVKQNYLKQFRKDIIQLTNYVYSICPSFLAIHNIMSVIRILQFLLPCLIPAYNDFWVNGSADHITIVVISIFSYILPPTSFFEGAHILFIIYIIIQLIVIFTVIFSTFHFKKYAKLPEIIPPFIAFYHATFGHLFHPIIIFYIFESISYLIDDTTKDRIQLTRFVILCVLSLICVLFNIYFMYIIMSQTLTIRPNSLMTTISPPQFFIFFSTIFINILFGIGVNLSKKGKIACFSVNIIQYGVTILSVFSFGGFIKTFISSLVISSSITGFFFTLVSLIFIIVDMKGSLALFFAFVIFFVLMLIVNFFIVQSYQLRLLKTLDSLQADPDLFAHIKSPNKFLQLSVVGMKFAHPIIIDLSFFMLGIEKWKRSQFVFLIYSKFIAIYPEETNTLKYIFKHVKIQKLNGYAIRVIRDQIRLIMKQREPGLTSELRQKLNRIKRQNQSTKHKLAHVWDVVIRRNLSEIDISTKRAFSAIRATDADFKHLLREFPNNRNVTHFYGIFLKEVVADFALAKEMSDRTKALLPGAIIEDQTHEYGLKAFPNLPNSIKVQKEYVPIASTLETVQMIQNAKDIDKEYQNDLDKLAGIKRSIDDLKIPAIRGAKVIEILASLIFLFLPTIAILIYVDIYVNDLKKPLEFISSLSMLRTYAYQVIGFSLRFVGESLSVFPVLNYHAEKPPTFLGGTWDTKEQLEYLLEGATEAIQDFGRFRTFKEKNYFVDQARNLIFQNTVTYDYYTSPTNVTKSNISIQAAILDFTIQQKMIIDAYEITPAILSSGTILNPVNNAYIIAANINTAFEYLIAYVTDNYERVSKTLKIVMIVLVIVGIIVPPLSLIIEVKWLNANMIETYQCLFSLPKNVVSELAENRESKNKENKNEETNKQDENILKIFNSGGSDDSVANLLATIIGTVLIDSIVVVNVILFCLLFPELAKIIKDMAPHLNYLQGSYAMLISSLNWLNVILFENSGNQIPTTSFNDSLTKIQSTLDQSHEFYHFSCCGGYNNEQLPFRGFTEGLSKASEEANANCFNPEISSKNLFHFVGEDKNDKMNNENFHEIQKSIHKAFVKSQFTSLTKVLECMPVDMTYILMDPIIYYSITPFRKGKISNLDHLKEAFSEIWSKQISPLYEYFFDPLHETMIPQIVEELKDKKNQYTRPIIALLIIGLILEIILYSQVFVNEKHLKSVLSLLLHCSPSDVFSNPKIMMVLSGDFSSQQSDSLTNSNEFFDTVFTSLPDAIMYANSEMIIQNANISCQHTFGDEELIGKSISDFFMSKKFTGNVDNLFSSVNSNPTEEIIYKKDNNSSETILKATSMIAGKKFVVSCRNVTQSHRYNTLIYEEKQNSDKLLSTILPPSLVERVQEGEKNISFAVQSASILFSDIVNFTPWCGSLPAEKVMSTLNILFKRFDSILDTKPTMTKIKCIGDCYMAAGGIFSEINQPALHAKEVVSFGIQSIKEIILIDEEINQKLQIRVGVNTGGPIVAGVLGIGKPTFEILGPAINRAQQMEHNGVPMKVHISIDVYELICGLNFKFCNRRQIEIKNEVVETYLVEP